MRCSAKRSVPRELTTSFFLISSRIILASERKDSERSSGDFSRFLNVLFTLGRGSVGLAAREGREWKKRVNDIRERGYVAAAWLVKEFSAGCGTRSFLGDDVLKFTVGVRSSLLLTGIRLESSTSDFYRARSCPERGRKRLGNSLRGRTNSLYPS